MLVLVVEEDVISDVGVELLFPVDADIVDVELEEDCDVLPIVASFIANLLLILAKEI